MEHPAASFWACCARPRQSAEKLRRSLGNPEKQSPREDWTEIRMEIREGTQHSPQGSRNHYLRMVGEFQHSGIIFAYIMYDIGIYII